MELIKSCEPRPEVWTGELKDDIFAALRSNANPGPSVTLEPCTIILRGDSELRYL